MAGRYPHPFIAREGWPFVGIAVAVSLLATWLVGWWSAPFWLLAVFILQFFRDPPRVVPAEPGAVVSAADGRVVEVSRVQDPYVKRDAIKVSVFMNVFNVHVNRYPVSGTVRFVHYNPGKFLNAATDKSSLENEQSSVGIESGSRRILVRQIAGLVARRIVTYSRDGDQVEQGERMGIIRFGSRVDVFLPTTARATVKVGDNTAAGASVIAHLVDQ